MYVCMLFVVSNILTFSLDDESEIKVILRAVDEWKAHLYVSAHHQNQHQNHHPSVHLIVIELIMIVVVCSLFVLCVVTR